MPSPLRSLLAASPTARPALLALATALTPGFDGSPPSQVAIKRVPVGRVSAGWAAKGAAAEGGATKGGVTGGVKGGAAGGEGEGEGGGCGEGSSAPRRHLPREVEIMREIEIMRELKHRYIVRYLGTHCNRHELFIVMEYVRGGVAARVEPQ